MSPVTSSLSEACFFTTFFNLQCCHSSDFPARFRDFGWWSSGENLRINNSNCRIFKSSLARTFYSFTYNLVVSLGHPSEFFNSELARLAACPCRLHPLPLPPSCALSLFSMTPVSLWMLCQWMGLSTQLGNVLHKIGCDILNVYKNQLRPKPAASSPLTSFSLSCLFPVSYGSPVCLLAS